MFELQCVLTVLAIDKTSIRLVFDLYQIVQRGVGRMLFVPIPVGAYDRHRFVVVGAYFEFETRVGKIDHLAIVGGIPVACGDRFEFRALFIAAQRIDIIFYGISPFRFYLKIILVRVCIVPGFRFPIIAFEICSDIGMYIYRISFIDYNGRVVFVVVARSEQRDGCKQQEIEAFHNLKY